jgi:hypothetical protein
MKEERIKKIVRRRGSNMVKNSSSCCASVPAQTKNDSRKTLRIEWQRLISNDKTCPRCGSTEEELDKAVSTLKQSLAPLDIEVALEKKELSLFEFKKAPLQSNRIWINNRPLEDYIGGSVGQSPCCDVCGPSECRTVKIEGQTYETIPSKIIIQAGLTAATQLVNAGNEKSCCSRE